MPRPTEPEPAPNPGGAPAPGYPLRVILSAFGIAGLAIVTLASPGATRMYVWPWSLALGAALVAPIMLLWVRAFDPRRPWVLPPPAWSGAMLLWSTVVLASALASPYRGVSLLWSAPLLAGPAVFLAVFDWLHGAGSGPGGRARQLLRFAGLFLALVAVVSLALWLAGLPAQPDWRSVWLARNGYPLGHSNYTAGLALLMLPCFAALAADTTGRNRAGWSGAVLLALGLLFTSGSRGGFAGLAMLALVATPVVARRLRLRLWIIAAAALIGCAVLVLANPRVREMFAGASADAPPNPSNVQRTAMVLAGARLGAARPLLGWGPGTTPLAYPRFRAGLDGGAENVLQLHSAPVQLWAELGAAGGLAALLLLGLAGRAAIAGGHVPDHSDIGIPPAVDGRIARPVLLGLTGYAVFSLTDWQLDVPVFTAASAIGLALIAPPGGPAGPAARLAGRLGPGLVLALVALLGRGDPTPALNAEALSLARNPVQSDRAAALLQESLGRNPDQEIAHFNLGWLLVVRDPAAAEREFLAAARLVPDKGGVYFGLGLARLNQDREADAARAFALEALNDPVFLVSPWWRVPAFAELRRKYAPEFIRVATLAADRLAARGGWIAREARYQAALTGWILGETAGIAAAASTPGRAAFFRDNPSPQIFASATLRAYRRERTGYPVLMRQPDLAPPTDLFDVQENALATGELRELFPAKGWLPSPLLLELLDAKNP